MFCEAVLCNGGKVILGPITLVLGKAVIRENSVKFRNLIVSIYLCKDACGSDAPQLRVS